MRGGNTRRAQLHRPLRAQHRCASLLSEVEFLKEMPGRDEFCIRVRRCPSAPAQRPCASAQRPCASAQRCCAPAQRPSALKNNWRRRGCRRQYTWLWGAATVGRGSVGRRSERYGKRGSPPTAFAQPDRSIDRYKYSIPMPQCSIEKRQF